MSEAQAVPAGGLPAHEKTGWCSPGRLRRSIKPLNACRMVVGKVFQSCFQPWEACMPIGIRHSAALPASS